jgi:hypothetical protein
MAASSALDELLAQCERVASNDSLGYALTKQPRHHISLAGLAGLNQQTGSPLAGSPRPLNEIVGTALAMSRGWIWHIPVKERSAAKAPLRLAALTARESSRAIKTGRASRPRRGSLG